MLWGKNIGNTEHFRRTNAKRAKRESEKVREIPARSGGVEIEGKKCVVGGQERESGAWMEKVIREKRGGEISLEHRFDTARGQVA